jgi:hypothetical protein
MSPKAMSVFSSMYGWKPPVPKKPREQQRQDVEERIHLEGGFRFRHFRAGTLLEDRKVKNLITNTGKAAVAGLILQTGSTNAFDYIGIGTGTQAAATTDTALQTEISTGGGERALSSLSRVTTDVSNDTSQLLHTFTFTTTGSYAVTEAAVFDSATSGTMLCRQTFAAITVTTNDTLEVKYKIDVD